MPSALAAAHAAPPPPFLAAVADEVTREAVRQAVGQFGWPAARVREGGVAAARELINDATSPGVLLVDVSDSADPVADLDALADVCEPHTRVLALGSVNDIALYRALMRMGVSEYLVKPVSAEAVVDAIRRAQQKDTPTAAAAHTAPIYAFIGARGGVGTTTVAVSTAWALAREHGKRAVLLDLDLQFGAAALSLDLEPERGLREILANPERIDSLLVSSAMTHAGDGLRILAAEAPLEEEVDLTPAGLAALVSALQDGCDAIVLDLPRRLDRLTREALARAEAVVVVSDLSLAAMRDAQRLLKFLKGVRPQGGISLVVNRAGGIGGELPQGEFAKGAGAPLDIVVPHDAKAAEAAAEQAKPLVEMAGKGPAGAELRRVAARLAGGDAAPQAAAAEPASWLKRVLGR